MIETTPARRAVLTALLLAGNLVAAQKLIIAVIEQEAERQYSLMHAIEQAALAKALGLPDVN